MKSTDLYLNHAGTSWPKPAVVTQAVVDAMNASPVDWPRRFDAAHQAIAAFFGVVAREQLLLTPGCTSALSIGIGDALIASGSRILTSHWEHHALHRPLLKWSSMGVRVEHIPPSGNTPSRGQTDPIDLDWLEQALTKQDVGLVAITAACNVTGELLPYQDVIRIARRHGVMVLLDAAQVVGWQPLDLAALGADLVAFGGHKGLQGPWGIGGLYLSDRARMECVSARCDLPAAGGGSRTNSPRPGYCDVGSVDQFALAGLHAAIEMLNRQSGEAPLAAGRRQIQRIRTCLQQTDRVRIFGPEDPSRGMPTVAIADPSCSSGELAGTLKRCGLIVGSGLHCAPLAHEALGTQDTGLVRLSVGLGQPDREIDDAIERLQRAFDDHHPQTH